MSGDARIRSSLFHARTSRRVVSAKQKSSGDKDIEHETDALDYTLAPARLVLGLLLVIGTVVLAVLIFFCVHEPIEVEWQKHLAASFERSQAKLDSEDYTPELNKWIGHSRDEGMSEADEPLVKESIIRPLYNKDVVRQR